MVMVSASRAVDLGSNSSFPMGLLQGRQKMEGFVGRLVAERPNSTHCVPQGRVSSDTTTSYRLVGLVVKASASRAEGPGFESRLRRDFYGVESYQ